MKKPSFDPFPVLRQAPSPFVGLAIAVTITYTMLINVMSSKQLGVAFDGKTTPGKVLLTGLGLLVYGVVLVCLPKTVPDIDYYLEETEPLVIFTLLRYTVLPIFSVVKVLLNIFLVLRNFKRLLVWRNALDKVGTFRMDVTSTDTVGQPLGFNAADRICTSTDRALSRDRTNYNHILDDISERLKRKPIRQDEVLVPTDEQVWSMCSKTVLSYNIMDQMDGDELLLEGEKCLDMTPMQFYMTIAEYHYTVTRVYLRPTKLDEDGIPTRGVVTKFVMNDGAVIREGDEHWDIAKLHFIATANLFFPAMQHNWVHYHFVDSATAMAKSIIPRGSFLMSILEPFILTNTETNANGIGGIVVGSKQSPLYSAVTINDSSNDYFANSIRHRTLAFYTGESKYILSDDVPLERVQFGFPPKFLENDNVPYTVCLRKSYEAFREFAGKVVEIISEDAEAIATFQYWCNEVVRRTSTKILAANVNHIDVLATMMWQVSMLHSLDHNAFFHWSEDFNGFSGARCDYKARDAKSKIYHADDVRTYREFIRIGGKYYPGKPDDSLRGVRRIYEKLQYPRKTELYIAFNQLDDKLNEYIKKYINEEGQGKHPGVKLDTGLIGSAILT
mmetsp:Transcript_13142/g.30948  ORF Transcript_13142/g.30948 Transcript_13142/m.30948 type:complete len:615 (-) Transcript_13142:157-2001(-)